MSWPKALYLLVESHVGWNEVRRWSLLGVAIGQCGYLVGQLIQFCLRQLVHIESLAAYPYGGASCIGIAISVAQSLGAMERSFLWKEIQ